ncbi:MULTISPECIES: DUF4279 domain-containing protein [Dyella]|uniref:DUF4279 domain-containing protein n=1 Tax=Dyella TaxID=231454 RepID=UPI0013F173FF|nr:MULTISPECIES: DUF4279 domain-containing protein [Dyella]
MVLLWVFTKNASLSRHALAITARHVYLEPNVLAQVSIYIRGEMLDPDALSDLLQIEPTKINRKGERRSALAHIDARYMTHTWVYSIKSDHSGVSDLALQVLSSFRDKHINVRALDGVDDAFLDIFYCEIPASGNVGESLEFSLDSQVIRVAAEMGLSIAVSACNSRE